jgi:hypothetical protein
VLLHHRELVVAGDQVLPGEQFVQHAAEGVEVAAGCDLAALDLFG